MGESPKNPITKPAKAMDWDNLRRRLATASMVVSSEPTQEEKQGILRKRAQTLARQPLQEETDGVLDVLEFLLTYETYAIEMRWVAETYPLKELTPLPGTPTFVAGIINVRGRILSVIDIRKFFDLPEKGLTDLNKVIIVHKGAMEFGILADEILGTRSIPLSEVQPPFPTLTGIREEYLKGVTRKRTAILDGAKLLTDRNLIVHEEVT
ncbi:MAG: purine-binding chemotaxis protein CheW [Steroidobacteraceae bacterium]|nr:purine-binding chemotaxis protein CheW [Deltaproteobacteria bacterium]